MSTLDRQRAETRTPASGTVQFRFNLLSIQRRTVVADSMAAGASRRRQLNRPGFGAEKSRQTDKE
jgi:hypothetical protein